MPIQDLRVIQLIDSLEPGGAERMAVTIANSLVEEATFSGIVVTRLEGSLKDSISSNVDYLYLKKKQIFDFRALIRLRMFVKKNKISIVHAHGSSYFFAVLLKFIMPSIKIFWHDHLGNRVKNDKANFFIKKVSCFFSGVFTVNQELKEWAIDHLNTSNIHFIPNFIEEKAIEKAITCLKGTEGKRIVLLANLRNPKNHFLALDAFVSSEIAALGWTMHFIGKDNLDDYSIHLKQKIEAENLVNTVYIYGSCNDVQHILNQANVGLLTSTYEGFPVTLLEYGRANIFVICSNVGYCSQIIKNHETGITFETGNVKELEFVFRSLPNNIHSSSILADNLNTFVEENFSEKIIVNKLVFSYLNKL